MLCERYHRAAAILDGWVTYGDGRTREVPVDAAREGAVFFRDPVGKLDLLNIECDKCGRRRRYHLDRLIERYRIDAKVFDWSEDITADCPRKQAMNLNDICGARCPDLPNVV